MRLDKYLSDLGIGTRKEVKALIKKKLISVNDSYDISSSSHIDENKDVVKYNNEILTYQKYYYFLFNKPKGYICANEDNLNRTIFDFFEEYNYLHLFSVGRLDKDTTGALIVTNDGELAHRLISPKYHVNKIYDVTLDKEVDPNIKDEFEKGILLDGELTLPAKFEYLDSRHVKVTLHQGKYHQVKRMFEYFSYQVVELHREQFAFLRVDNLKTGEYRILSDEEIAILKKI